MSYANFSSRRFAGCLREIVSKFSVACSRLQHLFFIIVVVLLAEISDRMESERVVEIQTYQSDSYFTQKVWPAYLCRIAKAQKY